MAVSMHGGADPMALVGRSVEGKYDVAAWVEQRGARAIYRAMHRMWAEAVTLEVLVGTPGQAFGADREALPRAFLRAGATLARLGSRSAAFVQVRDGGLAQTAFGQVPFHVCEWIEGASLRRLLEAGQRRSRARWTATQIFEWFSEPMRALGLAHAEGLVHRAIHPANLLVVGGTLRPLGAIKLVGFTEAALRSSAPGVVSTDVDPEPESLAPELHAGDPSRVGPWTDVYGLARVFAELLLGRRLPAGMPNLEPLPLELRFVLEQALAPSIEARFRGIESFRAAWAEAAMAITNERNPRQTMVVSAQMDDAESAGAFHVQDAHDGETDRPTVVEADAPRARVRLAHTQRVPISHVDARARAQAAAPLRAPIVAARRTTQPSPVPQDHAGGSGTAWRELPVPHRSGVESRTWFLLLFVVAAVSGLMYVAMLLSAR